MDMEAVRQAALQSIIPLTKEPKVRKHAFPTNLRPSRFNQPVLEFRDYLARNYDLTPTEILSNASVENLCNFLERHKIPDLERFEIEDRLKELGLAEERSNVGHILLAYLDPSRAQLNHMKSMVCNQCNRTGHIVSNQILT